MVLSRDNIRRILGARNIRSRSAIYAVLLASNLVPDPRGRRKRRRLVSSLQSLRRGELCVFRAANHGIIAPCDE